MLKTRKQAAPERDLRHSLYPLTPESMDMVERPGEDASTAEIARWMERDFGEKLADATREMVEERDQAAEDDENDDSDV